MKRTFTITELQESRGCYTTDQVNALPFNDKGTITLSKLFKTVPIKDFTWFLTRKSGLTTKQNQLFAVHCAELVLHIYEDRYPNDKRVRECIDATKLYLNGDVSQEYLLDKRNAAADADAAAADASYASAAAAGASAYAAYAADAADAAYAAYAADAADAASAAYAADAADAATLNAYIKSIWEYVKTIK